MPIWNPEPIWEGEEAVIIGGGPSLSEFPWRVLREEWTIGCNAAYQLGPDICSVVIFGDNSFYQKHRAGLIKYGGPVFTCCNRLLHSEDSWLRTVKSVPEGLSRDSIAWNGNTGAAAINLALLLGCHTVYLLGFDMKFGDQQAHWHDVYKREGWQPPDTDKFHRAFDKVCAAWNELFSDREIINVNDDSALVQFPMMSMGDFIAERRRR